MTLFADSVGAYPSPERPFLECLPINLRSMSQISRYLSLETVNRFGQTNVDLAILKDRLRRIAVESLNRFDVRLGENA